MEPIFEKNLYFGTEKKSIGLPRFIASYQIESNEVCIMDTDFDNIDISESSSIVIPYDHISAMIKFLKSIINE